MSALTQVRTKLLEIRRLSRSKVSVKIIAEGLDEDGSDSSSPEPDPLSEFDDFFAFAHQVETRPSWLKEATFVDVRNELSVAFRRDRIIAVHLAASIRDAFQSWLDKPPRPTVRRLSSEVLEQAILKGESRGLWLRGTHSPQKTMANSKNLVGDDLRQTITAVNDQTFTLASGKSILEDSPSRLALTGAVGTTPTRSLVWNRPMDNFTEFSRCALELIHLVRDEVDRIAAGSEASPVFPLLSRPVYDIDGVWGAYDISCANPVDLPGDPDDAKHDAAARLQEVALTVEGKRDSPNFEIAVGLRSNIGGRIRGIANLGDDYSRLTFGLKNDGTPPDEMFAVRDSLQHTDLLTIYYASGHVLTQGLLYKPQVSFRQFPNWEWERFDGYNIRKEKPGQNDAGGQDIHDGIGRGGDNSLFSWVLQKYNSGWLTCDDGAGELADFIHVAYDDYFTVTFIHVKRAENDSPGRKVSAVAYALVTSQAVKNTYFMDDSVLASHLRSAPVETPANWVDGIREPSRDGMLEALGERDARSKYRVVIVQPHQTETRYNQYYDAPGAVDPLNEDFLRLQRLETILNGGRPTMTGIGADLYVIGSK